MILKSRLLPPLKSEAKLLSGIVVALNLAYFRSCISLIPFLFMQKKVLIVEDYDDTRSFMKLLIQGYGYQVLEAVNGQQAVETVEKEHPDLVLMDIGLPVMGGLAATKTIRESEVASQLPIIALTAYGDSFYGPALEAGCNDFINKPLDFDKLEPVLKHYLQ